MTKLNCRPLSSVPLLLFLLVATGSNAQETPRTADRFTKRTEAISFRAFHIKLRDPSAMSQTMQDLLGGLPGGSFFGGGLLGGGGFGGGLFGGGGLGRGTGSGSGSGFTPPFDWRATVYPRTNVLLVRGTEAELAIATNVVNSLESPAERPSLTENLLAYQLKHVDAEVLARLLRVDQSPRMSETSISELIVLDPGVRVAAYRPTQMLIAAGSAAALQNLGAVIRELDVPGAEEPGDKTVTKVFRLKLCNPDDIKLAIEQLTAQEDFAGGLRQTPAQRGQEAGMLGAGFMGFGMGGLQHDPGGDELKIVVELRTRSLLVRGSDREVQIVSEMISILETPEGKALPQLKHVIAFPLRHADADELESTIESLGLKIRLVALPEARLLIADGLAEDLRSLRTVVKELDVATTEEPPEDQTKKLFR